MRKQRLTAIFFLISKESIIMPQATSGLTEQSLWTDYLDSQKNRGLGDLGIEKSYSLLTMMQ
jgi:hypothetical protein